MNYPLWRKIRSILLLVFCVGLIIGGGLFFYNASHIYPIREGFTTVPLNYDPDTNTSEYVWQDFKIRVKCGFVKGIQTEKNHLQKLVVRALSPLPEIQVEAGASSTPAFQLELENINPGFYAAQIKHVGNPQKTTVQTLNFSFAVAAGETFKIQPDQPMVSDLDRYVILGDSRDGYDTFGQIIEQVNELNPVFVVDNGDLVFSGKPNQYRLFDHMLTRITSTVCTTLGNHDIRKDGRAIYTRLYGPACYSFDYGNRHFIFLDSSRGWASIPAIPEEQYAWLERDLQKNQDKEICVISHVPPTDPRPALAQKAVAIDTSQTEQQGNLAEVSLAEINENAKLDHGFLDIEEAKRFESLMTQYHVDTVYLSHIHSYYDYQKDGVRYLISGGAGAELLTKNSYYHYLVVPMINNDSLTMIQLPSPVNQFLPRYAATVGLFGEALYAENKTAVVWLLIGLAALGILILFSFIIWLNRCVPALSRLIKDVGKYTAHRFKELFIQHR